MLKMARLGRGGKWFCREGRYGITKLTELTEFFGKDFSTD
jgi:hypothetical protein